ncbi:MAG: glutamine synthetase beta-grasp domain-containing protein, partial [Hyphomicrobiaceae bacterium]
MPAAQAPQHAPADDETSSLAAAAASVAAEVSAPPSVSLDPSGSLPSKTSETLKMTKYKLEYIWLDGYTPVPNLRGKTQIKAYETFPTIDQLPLWGFDGSSTKQADGSSSDCVLKPVAVYPDPARSNGVLVMCEVMLPDGTPHPSNKRATIL